MQKRPRIRVAVAVLQEEQILLVEHTKNGRSYWLLPGGGLEWGEGLHEAVCREVEEETGLRIQAGDLLFASETLAPDSGKHLVHLVFAGQLLGGRIAVPEEARITDVRWFPLPEVCRLTLHPPMQAALSKLSEARLSKPGADPTFLGNLWVD
jgi:ADP-ribose pyrophosphatase YjhB (NUDIX family)